jgi:hypothetical protein
MLYCNVQTIEAMDRMGHLYLLRHAFRPWLKVGITKNINTRMSSYAHAWGVEPFPPLAVHGETLFLMDATARDMEAHILRRFRSVKVGGEWIRMTPEVYAMEKAASVLHRDTVIDYADAIVPFAHIVGWPESRLRFKKRPKA